MTYGGFTGNPVGYINYVVVLFIVTGFLILRFDAKGYGLRKMHKEQKAARIIGWANLLGGIVTFVGHWVYQKLL
ncbi:CLC_0170 family protein [Effusibacillus lacus]|uniref:Uncharacterized protein n=1 Tax=Effusibacillus lacus TaxID=1348429 RepID=A0A292YLG8_9BACL|nr:CLC_0170 family protein [Effusibacillus lacus]TCS73559.1 hypothetical protein EDD64_11866 [Effusibacillus lacus]GAX91947.1 hypothetical protein EFBL_3638 [Effusibacillus lacus]